MDSKTATELREKLDALDIEHFDYDKGGRTQTMWEAPDGNRHFHFETFDNQAKTSKLTISWFPTPEQAIAATLGSDARKTSNLEWLMNRAGYYRDADYEWFSNLVVDAAEKCGFMPDGFKYHYQKRDWLMSEHFDASSDGIEADIDCYRDEDCPDYLRVPVYRVRSWLDCQAAITRREVEAEMGAGECKITTSATDGLCGDDPKVYYELSCGHRMMLYGLDVPIRCAVCGKVVKR